MAVVLITGTSTGIGLEAALHFARRGDRVFAGLRKPGAAAELQQGIASGLPIEALQLDVCDDASVQAAVGQVLKEAGQVDVLINNAGLGGSGSLEAVPLEVAQRMMETNYFGCVRMMRAVLPSMRERRSGAIICVTSQAGRRPFAMMSHYCASKSALTAACTVMAHEVRAFGIRVALIEPGTVLTPIFGKAEQPEGDEPYEMHQRRLVATVMKGIQNGSPTSVVAEAIEHALATDKPRLHYPVAYGAEDNLRVYAEQGPDSFVEDGAIEDDDAFFELMRERYGYEIR